MMMQCRRDERTTHTWSESENSDAYKDLLEQLRRNDCCDLNIYCQGYADLVLQNVDEICRLIRLQTNLNEITIGYTAMDGDQDTKLEATEESAAAWKKLLTALGSVEFEKLTINGHNMSESLMAQVAGEIQQVDEIELRLPWGAARVEDMMPFVNAISQHPCRSITAFFSGRNNNGLSKEDVADHSLNSLFEQLSELETVQEFVLHNVDFTRDECIYLNAILSSDTWRITTLRIDRCHFHGDNGGKDVAKAFESNKYLKRLILDGWFQDKPLGGALVTFLPLNQSIQHVTIGSIWQDSALDVAQLLKNVFRHNRALKIIEFHSMRYRKSASNADRRELQQEVQQNCTLKYVGFFGGREPFKTVTSLNKAGRQYLSQDPTSNSKCIAVLAKVKHNLDCLYYHMRENPILCISYCKSAGGLSGRKRKADESA